MVRAERRDRLLNWRLGLWFAAFAAAVVARLVGLV